MSHPTDLLEVDLTEIDDVEVRLFLKHTVATICSTQPALVGWVLWLNLHHCDCWIRSNGGNVAPRGEILRSGFMQPPPWPTEST